MRSTTPTTAQTPHRPRRGRVLTRLLATFFLAAGLLVTSAGAIGASADGCGEYSFGFTGTRLINDGISDSAGPYSISLPAGTYDITMWSNDNHPSADYQVEQTNEQWYFLLNNGYQSPPTDDIPADGTSVITTVSNVDIAEATSISVHHVKIGGVNSVNVECVGFTPSVVVAAPATTTEAPKVVASPSTTETSVAPAAPATTAAPEVTVAPTTTAVSVEVKQEVEVPAAQLAVTGPRSNGLIALGLGLLGLGLGCLAIERRSIARI